MEELRQVFSDKAEVSAIINKNMPVMEPATTRTIKTGTR